MEPKTELQRNAIALARRKELETYQRALDIQWLNSRMDDSHIGRHLAQIHQEAEMERDFQERTDHSAIVNARTQKEIALASEIARQSQEEISQLQRRHYLRERDPELRELLKRLEASYVSRDLRQQILHKQYKHLQDEAEDRRQNRILASSLAIDAEAVRREAQETMEKKAKLLLEMQQQLVDRQRVKQCEYEETLIEKKMLEDVMITMADEDRRELEQKREQAEKLQKQMETFKRARDAWKEKQKKLLVIEERNIEKQIKEAGDRSLAIVAERERKFREKELLNEKIAAKIMADRAAILEREDIIKSLQEQEYLEKNVQDDIAELEKVERNKRQTEASLTEQIEARRRRRVEQRKKEAEFRRESEAEAEAMRQKDLEKEMKLKLKKKQYGRELIKQMEEDAKRRKELKRQENEEGQYVFDYEKAWIAEAKEERKRIVEQHAAHVLGYLHPGALVPEDLPYIKRGASKDPDLAKLDIDSIAETKRAPRLPKCNSKCRILREY